MELNPASRHSDDRTQQDSNLHHFLLNFEPPERQHSHPYSSISLPLFSHPPPYLYLGLGIPRLLPHLISVVVPLPAALSFSGLDMSFLCGCLVYVVVNQNRERVHEWDEVEEMVEAQPQTYSTLPILNIDQLSKTSPSDAKSVYVDWTLDNVHVHVHTLYVPIPW